MGRRRGWLAFRRIYDDDDDDDDMMIMTVVLDLLVRNRRTVSF